MKIPKRSVGSFAKYIVDLCSASREERLQRGSVYRNLYLTGDEAGEPATFPKTFAYIDNLSSYLYSPVELRFAIEHYGGADLLLRAQMQAANAELNKHIRRGNVDTKLESAVNWSLVKGKSFIKLLWTKDGFQPTVIQPEMMGVLREDLDSLSDQDAFFHTTYLTPDRFTQMVENHPDRDELIRKATKYMSPVGKNDGPDQNSHLKQVILGGLNPYQAAGGNNNNTKQRGWVQWMNGPLPNLAPEVLTRLIPLNELWVWDDERGESGDWTTIQFVGEDCVIYGKDTHRNIFADAYDPDNKERILHPSSDNPLAGHHPFIEICPNPLDSYFWGRSELCNVALLQKGINTRIDGINHLLRMQEKPPRFFKGGQSITASAYSKLNKPGGYMTDNNPNATVQTLAPELPSGLWDSLHEYEQMFNDMAGFSPVMQGRGESGVRAQGHAESLIRTSSPRFKDRALLVERQVEELGGLAFDMLKAHLPYPLTAWVSPKDAGIMAKIPPTNPLHVPPIPDTIPVEFSLHDLPDECKVVVDSHSSSPAFSHETRELLFSLFKAGAIKLDQLVAHTHPPGEDTIIEDIHRAEIEKAKFIQQHPEVAEKQAKKSHR